MHLTAEKDSNEQLHCRNLAIQGLDDHTATSKNSLLLCAQYNTTNKITTHTNKKKKMKTLVVRDKFADSVICRK